MKIYFYFVYVECCTVLCTDMYCTVDSTGSCIKTWISSGRPACTVCTSALSQATTYLLKLYTAKIHIVPLGKMLLQNTNSGQELVDRQWHVTTIWHLTSNEALFASLEVFSVICKQTHSVCDNVPDNLQCELPPLLHHELRVAPRQGVHPQLSPQPPGPRLCPRLVLALPQWLGQVGALRGRSWRPLLSFTSGKNQQFDHILSIIFPLIYISGSR